MFVCVFFFSAKTTWFANNKSTKQPKFSEGVGLQSVGRNFWMPHYPYFGSPALYFCVFEDLNGALNGLTVGWGARGKKRTFPILKELFLKENLWGFFREGCVVGVCQRLEVIFWGSFLCFLFRKVRTQRFVPKFSDTTKIHAAFEKNTGEIHWGVSGSRQKPPKLVSFFHVFLCEWIYQVHSVAFIFYTRCVRFRFFRQRFHPV